MHKQPYLGVGQRSHINGKRVPPNICTLNSRTMQVYSVMARSKSDPKETIL